MATRKANALELRGVRHGGASELPGGGARGAARGGGAGGRAGGNDDCNHDDYDDEGGYDDTGLDEDEGQGRQQRPRGGAGVGAGPGAGPGAGGKLPGLVRSAISAFVGSEEQDSLSQMTGSQVLAEAKQSRQQQKAVRKAVADTDTAQRAAAANKLSSKNVALATGSASGPVGLALALSQKERVEKTAVDAAARLQKKTTKSRNATVDAASAAAAAISKLEAGGAFDKLSKDVLQLMYKHYNVSGTKPAANTKKEEFARLVGGFDDVQAARAAGALAIAANAAAAAAAAAPAGAGAGNSLSPVASDEGQQQPAAGSAGAGAGRGRGGRGGCGGRGGRGHSIPTEAVKPCPMESPNGLRLTKSTYQTSLVS